jgi:glycosyltransferase involved in cell wall biosynthesis
MRVSQILCAAGPVDAVTNQALAWRRRFASWGWEGEDYVANIAPGVTPSQLRPLPELPAEGPVVLHYSGHAHGLEAAVGRTTLLVSHNVTPPRYFWAHQPVDAARCTLARDQLGELALAAGEVAGVSGFNARQLRELSGRSAEVIPILFEASPPPAPDRAGPEPGAPRVLFVGRLAPHKRQDLVIEAFARLRQRHPGARLNLVGTSLNGEFEAELRRMADALAPGGVSFETGGISREQLANRYRLADVFLCLSEHEGFGIPLLEAFHCGVPVIARDAGAVGEVVGDAGLLLGEEDNVAVAAELLSALVSDPELRDELRRRGRRRLEAYDPEATAAKMRAAIEAL